MNVIYNTCYADPWIQVAKKLLEDHKYEPVYWIGYEDDDSAGIVPNTFENIIYHPYYNAWAGEFPSVIEKEFSNYQIDVDFIRKYAVEELLAYKMMDRMDPYRYNFNFMERQAHFRKMLRYWCAVIDFVKPDLVISASIPHRVYDYALYLLCKHNSIPFVSFLGTHFVGRIIPTLDINTIGDYLNKEYNTLKLSSESCVSLKNKIVPEIANYLDKIQIDYSKGRPDFVPQDEKKDKNYRGITSITRLTNYIFVQRWKNWFGKKGILKNGVSVYMKINRKKLSSKNPSLIQYSILKFKTNQYKNQLKKYYSKYTWTPDFDRKYVLFNLHYQPEATSSPAGDIFVDLSIIVNTLSKHLPDDFLIYVKEHPAQFYAHREGHTNRIKSFYSDLLSINKVRLLPLNYDPFKLIRNAEAVATISGSVGWEAMVLGKPVISFGISWYEKYSGILRVVDEASARRITSFISDFVFDEKELLAYLAAFSEKAVKAYYYKNLKQKLNQSEEECVNKLVKAITGIVNNA